MGTPRRRVKRQRWLIGFHARHLGHPQDRHFGIGFSDRCDLDSSLV
jgi:hypothetical protein